MKLKINESFPKVTDQQLTDLENILIKPLPSDYKKFLKTNNGGRPTPNILKTIEGNYETDIQFFFGITKDFYDIKNNLNDLQDRLPKNVLPIAIDSTGNFIILDLDNEHISLFDHEIEELFLIAYGFTQFLDGLYKNDYVPSAIVKAIISQNVFFF